MRLIFRAVLPLLFGLVLSGCNMVVSEQPWFSVADTQGAPRLKNGLWVQLDEPSDCRVNVERQAHTWPECADPLVVRGSEVLALGWEQPVAGKPVKRTFTGWQSAPLMLAAGDPTIVQIFQPAETESKAYYMYIGLRPVSFDAEGQVTSLTIWLVQCGPLNESRRTKPGDGREPSYVTSTPYPGLEMKGDNCIADSRQSLRNAARLSDRLAPDRGEENMAMRWVRDSWP